MPRRAVAGLLLVLLAAATAAQAAPKRPMTVDDLMKVRSVRQPRLSPDGEWVVYVVSVPDREAQRHDSDLWLVAFAGGKPRRLTRAPGRDDTPRWSPDGKTIAFLSDREGKPQVWLIDPEGGEARKLTSAPGGVKAHEWSPDGKVMAFVAAPESKPSTGVRLVRPPEPDRLFVVPAGGGKAKALTPATEHVAQFSWSSNGAEIVYAHHPSASADDMYQADLSVVAVDGGKVRSLVHRPGLDMSPSWSPDGKTIAFVSHGGKLDPVGNTHLCVVPAKGGRPRTLTATFDEKVAVAEGPTWSPDGKSIHFLAHQRLSTRLFASASADGAVVPLTPDDGVCDGFSFSPNGERLAVLREDARTPAEVYAGPASGPQLRLTTTNPQLSTLALGRMVPLRWKSKDGTEVEGVLVEPVGHEPGRKCALLTYLHGGPALQFRLAFTPYGTSPQAQRYPIQVFAGKGHAVFCPNPRGSGGYGAKFRKANIQDWGGGDYQDVQAGIDHLIARGLADPKRLGVMGWSYGGYLTAWTITQTDRFRAASAGAGIFNPTSFYGQTDIPFFLETYFGGTPWSNPAGYARSSPLAFAGKVKTPTLIQFGEKDVRVALSQGEELHAALKRVGVPVEFAVYPGQGHVVVEPNMQADVLQRNVDWFDRWLKREGGAQAPSRAQTASSGASSSAAGGSAGPARRCCHRASSTSGLAEVSHECGKGGGASGRPAGGSDGAPSASAGAGTGPAWIGSSDMALAPG